MNIVEAASEFTALRRQGTRYTGLCPYPDHSEKTPSFSVDPDRGLYHCFGCKMGGDTIKLIMDLKSFSFAEAVAFLAERSGVELEYEGGSPAESRAARDRDVRRRAIHKSLAAAAIYYHKYLTKSSTPEAENARRYLESRSIEYSTIVEFRLGYAPRAASAFMDVARRLDLDRKVLEAAGLLSSRGGERFFGRITFPISDRRGRIVGFGGRALGDTQPKYLNSPETEVFNKRDLLYGFPQVLERIRKKRAALIVEGYTDVLMLYQSGIRNAVATLGTATTRAHLRILSGYADRIHVLFDPDAAGERAIERAAATAAELKLDLRVLRLPQDPADWLLEHPPEEFAGLLSQAVPVLEYGIRRIVERARGAGAVDRSRAVPEMKALIKEIQDPVLHREAVRLATEALGVSSEALREPRTPVARSERSTSRPAPLDPHEQAGREVLALILARPDLTAGPLQQGIRIPSVPEPLKLRAEDFAEEGDAMIFSVFDERAGEDPGRVLSDGRLRPFVDRIALLASERERLYPSEASIREAWLRLAVLSRQRAKQTTPDYDAKERLQSEIRVFKEALRTGLEP